MTIIMEIPVVYSATYIPRGARTARLDYVVDLEPVAVRQAAEKEAPVAAVLHQTGDHGGSCYRILNGRLMRQVAADTAAAQEQMTRLFIDLSADRANGQAWKMSPKFRILPRAYYSRTIEAKHWLSDTRNAVAAGLQDEAQGWVMIGGALYVPSMGPFLSVESVLGTRATAGEAFYRVCVRPELGWAADPSLSYPVLNRTRFEIIPADKTDDAETLLRHTMRADQTTYGRALCQTRQESGSLEILKPWDFSQAKHISLTVAVTAMVSDQKKTMGTIGPEGIREWIALRSMLENGDTQSAETAARHFAGTFSQAGGPVSKLLGYFDCSERITAQREWEAARDNAIAFR
jgi:hypothetical protein